MPDLDLPNPKELGEVKEKTFERRVALTTAIFAVVLAIAALGANKTMKEMLLAQQQASDQWAFYQARSIREHQYRGQKLRLEADLAERGAAMKPDARQKYEALLAKLAEEEKRYNTEKQEVEKEARALERERDISRTRDPYFEFAEVLLQIAIVLSSISILSGSRPVFFISLAVASLGALLTLNGYTLLVSGPFLPGGH
jgi:uncharacterized protein DUF4337